MLTNMHHPALCHLRKQSYIRHNTSSTANPYAQCSVVPLGFVDEPRGRGRAAGVMERQHGRRTNHGTIARPPSLYMRLWVDNNNNYNGRVSMYIHIVWCTKLFNSYWCHTIINAHTPVKCTAQL